MKFTIENALDDITILEDFKKPEFEFYLPRPVNIKILFLCEGISFDSTGGFSFGELITLLRENAPVKYANFELVLANWASNPASTVTKDTTPGEFGATYNNYRFSSLDPDSGDLILDDFHEVWMFGIAPNTNYPVARDTILASSLCPTEQDLEAITRWMNNGGGVLAMGDHASLGANLCAKIPRVWTMRRWTAEDQAPPRIGPDRVDTNQPMWPAQDPDLTGSPSVIPFEAQSDDVAQKIQPRYYYSNSKFFYTKRPHPILCDGKLGVLNYLPDHPHEGWVNETSEINLGANIQLESIPADINPKEYPSGTYTTPKPEVIAWGNTPPAPPHIQEKGASPAKHFGVIGAYNGHQANIGRVVVDSTWHHWMSVNLAGEYEPFFDGDPNVPGNQDLEGLKEANNTAYKKIVAYYRNVAVWLAPKSVQQKMLSYCSFYSVLSTRTFEEWNLSTPTLLLGREGIDVLGRSISKCFVSRWVLELIPLPYLELIPEWNVFEQRQQVFGPITLSLPDNDSLESLAMGTLMKNMMLLRDEFSASAKSNKKRCDDDLDKKLQATFELSRKQAAEAVIKRIEDEQKMLGAYLKGFSSTPEKTKKAEFV